MGRHALSAAGEAHTLLRSGLDADLVDADVQVHRDIPPHLPDIGCDLRTLGHQRHVHVAYGKAVLLHLCRHLPQQDAAADSLIARVAVRKQVPDIPQRRRAQQGVHQGVEEHVRVRMARKTKLKGNLNAAQ